MGEANIQTESQRRSRRFSKKKGGAKLRRRRLVLPPSNDLIPTEFDWVELFKNSSIVQQPPQPVQQDKPLSEMIGELFAEVLITAGRAAWKKASPKTFVGYSFLTNLLHLRRCPRN